MFNIAFLMLTTVVAQQPTTTKVPVGKETTFVNGPVDGEGFIDYDAAFNQHFGRGIKPDDNANVLLSRALGPKAADERVREKYFKALGIPVPPERGDYFVALRSFLEGKPEFGWKEIEAAMGQLNELARGPWTAKDHPHLAAWLKANEKPLSLVVEASKCMAYYNPRASRDWLFDGLQFGALLYRQIGLALAARAMLHLVDGKSDDAWKDLLASHRLARLISRDASLSVAFAAVAIQRNTAAADVAFLEHSKLSTKQLQDCLKDMQALPPFSSMVEKLDIGSRFEFLDATQAMRRGTLTARAKKDEAALAINRFDWAMIMRDGNRWYDQIAAAMRIDNWAEREKAFEKIDEGFREASKKNLKGKIEDFLKDEKTAVEVVSKAIGQALMGQTMPNFGAAARFADEREQIEPNVQVGLALAIWRSENGRYPAKLDDLVPKYLAEVPRDLYSAQSLVYRPSATGYALYSIGPNLKDDKGQQDDIAVHMPQEARKPKK